MPLQPSVLNRLLRTLQPSDYALIAPNLHWMAIAKGTVLEHPTRRSSRVVFIETGIVNKSILGPGDLWVNAGMIGYEGMTGRSVILGTPYSSYRVQADVEAEGWSVEAHLFRRALQNSSSLRELMMTYVQSEDVQRDYDLIVATSHLLLARVARWLLMYADRLKVDSVAVTHVTMASILNVRRASISSTLKRLEDTKTIQVSRGSIRILSRESLIACANGTYGVAERALERMIDATRRID